MYGRRRFCFRRSGCIEKKRGPPGSLWHVPDPHSGCADVAIHTMATVLDPGGLVVAIWEPKALAGVFPWNCREPDAISVVSRAWAWDVQNGLEARKQYLLWGLQYIVRTYFGLFGLEY